MQTWRRSRQTQREEGSGYVEWDERSEWEARDGKGQSKDMGRAIKKGLALRGPLRGS